MNDKDIAQDVSTVNNGMAVEVAVYVVKTENASCTFTTKTRANNAVELLTMFNVHATIETVKKVVQL